MNTKASFLALAVAFATLLGVYALDRNERENQKNTYKAEVQSEISTIKAKLEGGLNSRLFLEKGLVAFVLTHLDVNPDHQITQEELDKFCMDFMPQLLGIRNIALVQNNIITHVYPLQGNEKALGSDLSLVPDQREAFVKAAKDKQGVLTGPVDLVQGGVGLINRTPIYWTPRGGGEAVYWGQSSLIIMQDTLFREAGLYDKPGLRFAIRAQNGRGYADKSFFGDDKVFQSEPVIVDVSFSGGSWQLAAVPAGGWARNATVFYWIWTIGFILAVCAGALVWFLINSLDMRKRIQDSEERFRQMFTKQQAVMCLLDSELLAFIDVNEAAQRFYGYSPDEFRRMAVADISVPPGEGLGETFDSARYEQGCCEEGKHRLRSGEIRDVEIRTTLIRLKTKQFLFSIVHDITDRKQAEEKIRYTSFHDSITGLYNRTFFEERIRGFEAGKYFSGGLIICDLDGLKLINDTLGHDYGDHVLVAVADILTRCAHEKDVVARIGGDEFALILAGATQEQVAEVCHKIMEEVEHYNKNNPVVPMSLSVGSAVRNGQLESMGELFKEADNAMYREKLHRSQSTRNAIVQTVKSLLAARDFITEGHVDRLQDMVSSLGKNMGLPENRLADLRLLAQFHDIGKVGIPDKILFKAAKLSAEEVVEMQRHCEIGHRIALSSPDTMPIADWVLKHHEWWNGQGYPLGLAGENIPLECRILAIVDAYDAMTNDRPYRKALQHDEALAELKKCAGTQFDPVLVQSFCDIIAEFDNEDGNIWGG